MDELEKLFHTISVGTEIERAMGDYYGRRLIQEQILDDFILEMSALALRQAMVLSDEHPELDFNRGIC